MRKVLRRLPLPRPVACAPLFDNRRAMSDGAPRTYYDYLDRMWNRQWFGATEAIAPVPDAMPFANAFVACQEALGVHPAAALVLFGALTRLVTLCFSLRGERASQRMRIATCRLRKPHEAFQRVYYSEGSSALEIQLAATALKGERRRVFREERTSNLRCLSTLLGSPLVLFGVYESSAMCENPLLRIGSTSFFWCPALALSDPYGLLPLAFCAITLLNFELAVPREIRTGWMKNLMWGARLGCLCVIPAAASFRSGVCLYFLGMSLAGLVQPLLLRNEGFRRWFDFPDPKRLQAADPIKHEDELQTRMELQFPYLAHLLSPETEENASLLRNETERSHSTKQPQPSTRHEQEEKYKQTKASPHLSSSRVMSRKGTDFASSSGGWKAARVEFQEEDFIPELGNSTTRTKDGVKR